MNWCGSPQGKPAQGCWGRLGAVLGTAWGGNDCSQDTDGCPKHVWDGVGHEHQLPQAWKGHVPHAWDREAGNGLYGPQKCSLSVTVIWPVASAVSQRQS